MTDKQPMYGVYLVLKNGGYRYVERSATTSRKLAEEIADDLTHGVVVKPDGSTQHIRPRPHIAREM